jgi:hypothetical protein
LLNLFILLLLPKNKIIKTAKNGNLVKETPLPQLDNRNPHWQKETGIKK